MNGRSESPHEVVASSRIVGRFETIGGDSMATNTCRLAQSSCTNTRKEHSCEAHHVNVFAHVSRVGSMVCLCNRRQCEIFYKNKHHAMGEYFMKVCVLHIDRVGQRR